MVMPFKGILTLTFYYADVENCTAGLPPRFHPRHTQRPTRHNLSKNNIFVYIVKSKSEIPYLNILLQMMTNECNIAITSRYFEDFYTTRLILLTHLCGDLSFMSGHSSVGQLCMYFVVPLSVPYIHDRFQSLLDHIYQRFI